MGIGDNTSPADFEGWELDGSRPHSVATLPLIPPNQDLTVTMAAPGTLRTDPLGSVIQQPGTALDPAVKAIWYTADISGNLPPGRRQVIFEQGGFFAYRYNWDGSQRLRDWLNWIKALPYGPAWLTDREAVFHQGYPYLRWYFDPTQTPFSPQVPTGDFSGTSGTSLEAL